jgi:NAD(P)-dependent dehydrogenase (short-subunit alcohol dehydrogenase family)
MVCLNAGVARKTDATDVARTQDGFELTVGTNHLGHFYLQHLLLPLLSRSKIGGRLVITASGVHDPQSPGGAQGVPATLGNLLGLERDGKRFEMVDGGAFNADKAYKDSKVHIQTTYYCYCSKISLAMALCSLTYSHAVLLSRSYSFAMCCSQGNYNDDWILLKRREVSLPIVSILD